MDDYDSLIEAINAENNLKILCDAANYGNELARNVIKNMLKGHLLKGEREKYNYLLGLLKKSLETGA